ncbi:MAG TPA: FtsX-like permease family protein, partial [Thermoanaerobaculia bacterium]|nr:FtsX-like permease family protein [Thermoanaerobaculia bacterium]
VPGSVGLLADAVAKSRAQRRFALLLIGTFASLTLLLAALGVYGVVAYAVARRTRELGVRLALGAAPGQAQRLVLRGALAPVVTGIAIALLAAAPLTRGLRALLFEVRPWDPASWLLAAAVLGGAALLAGWLPARRATRIDPQLALRSE